MLGNNYYTVFTLVVTLVTLQQSIFGEETLQLTNQVATHPDQKSIPIYTNIAVAIIMLVEMVTEHSSYQGRIEGITLQVVLAPPLNFC